MSASKGRHGLQGCARWHSTCARCVCKTNPSLRIVRQLVPMPACVLLELATIRISNMCHGASVSRHPLCGSGKQSMTCAGRQSLDAMQSTLLRVSCEMRITMT